MTPFPCFAFSLLFHILPSLSLYLCLSLSLYLSLSLLCMLFAACRNNMLLLICHVYLTGGNKVFACLLAYKKKNQFVKRTLNERYCFVLDTVLIRYLYVRRSLRYVGMSTILLDEYHRIETEPLPYCERT